jgi:glycosyltransferase involved in cell wall biosynthesis
MNKTILFVVNNLNIGGPQKSLLSLLHNFPEDYEVDLIVLNKELGLEKYLPKNVSLIEISNEIPLLILNKNNVLKMMFFNIFRNPLLVFKSLSFLISNLLSSLLVQKKQEFWVENKSLIKPDVYKIYDYAIGVSGGHSIMYIADYINARCKVGWVRTEYQNLNRNLGIDHTYFEKLNMILSVSNKCSNKFIEIFPDQREKVKTFYNPLPYKMYNNLFGEENDNNFKGKLDDNSIMISTISRLDKNKGFDLVIEAAKLLKENNYNFIWNIYGIGPIKEHILRQLKVHDLEGIVHLKGFEFNTGLILKNTDILVHPSKFEGKSNTIDEAKYYAIPIVSTNFPTVGEQLSNNYSAIITQMDGNSLFNGIIKMINNTCLRKKITENLTNEHIMSRDVFNEFISTLESEAVK